ncbi:STAS domain-containing protein [Nonomuraea sp. NPDC001023]|uniref:STAS domain-containing protein n=1 Tax=unclassified Nonomuraea TaxID=2593643 RepID=UPI003332D35A
MDTADTAGIRTPDTVADPLLRITPLVDSTGLRIEGELDYATLPVLTRALASMARGGSFCVDLSGLVFCGVGGLRALVTPAAGMRDGQVLTLRSPSPQVRRLLQLTGWHPKAGLRLQDRSTS